jgi:2-octaprenyl-6-methoxyphenol hydroxylase
VEPVTSALPAASDTYDVVIVGGGPVGSAFALMLSRSGLRIAVLEARKPPPNETLGDGRTLALSYGSRLILDRLGAWPDSKLVTPVEAVHVSQRGSFGRTVLRAIEVGVPALGYTLSYNLLSECLSNCVNGTAIEYLWDATVTQVASSGGHPLVQAQIAGMDCTLRARLAVLADGGKGLLQTGQDATARGRGAIDEVHEKDYAQCALSTLVRTERPHNHIAYERFTPQGPTALLPVRDRFALVWVAEQAVIERLLRLSDAEVLSELQRHFGDRQGRFLEVGARYSYPLRLRYARAVAAPGVVRIGNAAQALHPAAAQGFNLGLRDAWALSRLILAANGQGLNGAELARAYARTRRIDRAVGIGFTDFLVTLFGVDRPLTRAARGAGLWLMQNGGPLRRAFTRAMMFGAPPR